MVIPASNPHCAHAAFAVARLHYNTNALGAGLSPFYKTAYLVLEASFSSGWSFNHYRRAVLQLVQWQLHLS